LDLEVNLVDPGPSFEEAAYEEAAYEESAAALRPAFTPSGGDTSPAVDA